MSETSEALLRQIYTILHELVDEAQIARDRAAKVQNLHPTDMACIAYLGRQKGAISAKQITTHLAISSGSGTALLDRLEAVGYIRRLPNPEDRRGVLIEVDRVKAKEPLRRLAEIEQRYSDLTQSFSAVDFAVILRFLGEVNQIAKAFRAD